MNIVVNIFETGTERPLTLPSTCLDFSYTVEKLKHDLCREIPELLQQHRVPADYELLVDGEVLQPVFRRFSSLPVVEDALIDKSTVVTFLVVLDKNVPEAIRKHREKIGLPLNPKRRSMRLSNTSPGFLHFATLRNSSSRRPHHGNNLDVVTEEEPGDTSSPLRRQFLSASSGNLLSLTNEENSLASGGARERLASSNKVYTTTKRWGGDSKLTNNHNNSHSNSHNNSHNNSNNNSNSAINKNATVASPRGAWRLSRRLKDMAFGNSTTTNSHEVTVSTGTTEDRVVEVDKEHNLQSSAPTQTGERSQLAYSIRQSSPRGITAATYKSELPESPRGKKKSDSSEESKLKRKNKKRKSISKQKSKSKRKNSALPVDSELPVILEPDVTVDGSQHECHNTVGEYQVHPITVSMIVDAPQPIDESLPEANHNQPEQTTGAELGLSHQHEEGKHHASTSFYGVEPSSVEPNTTNLLPVAVAGTGQGHTAYRSPSNHDEPATPPNEEDSDLLFVQEEPCEPAVVTNTVSSPRTGSMPNSPPGTDSPSVLSPRSSRLDDESTNSAKVNFCLDTAEPANTIPTTTTTTTKTTDGDKEERWRKMTTGMSHAFIELRENESGTNKTRPAFTRASKSFRDEKDLYEIIEKEKADIEQRKKEEEAEAERMRYSRELELTRRSSNFAMGGDEDTGSDNSDGEELFFSEDGEALCIQYTRSSYDQLLATTYNTQISPETSPRTERAKTEAPTPQPSHSRHNVPPHIRLQPPTPTADTPSIITPRRGISHESVSVSKGPFPIQDFTATKSLPTISLHNLTPAGSSSSTQSSATHTIVQDPLSPSGNPEWAGKMGGLPTVSLPIFSRHSRHIGHEALEMQSEEQIKKWFEDLDTHRSLSADGSSSSSSSSISYNSKQQQKELSPPSTPKKSHHHIPIPIPIPTPFSKKNKQRHKHQDEHTNNHNNNNSGSNSTNHSPTMPSAGASSGASSSAKEKKENLGGARSLLSPLTPRKHRSTTTDPPPVTK
eukprot:TRINITY_DN844_c4_g1_i1.p1 TRINITY_DN844_c4_g1~~TRINITY_DN844_c4_g1_i1.p1  ORF type:complete len:1011 (-),score=256.20 TRINITY_DN844_c4_g1_i1:36-3068(-)